MNAHYHIIGSHLSLRRLTLAGLCLLASCGPSNPPPTKNEATEVPKPPHDPLKLPAGILDNDELGGFIHAAEAYKPKDQFSPKQLDATPLLGRKFHIVVPVGADANNGVWDYDADKGILDMSFEPINPGHGEHQSILNFIPWEGYEKSYEPQQMGNAFGAVATVTRSSVFYTGVGSTSDQYMGVFPKKNLGGGFFQYSYLAKKIKISPDEARALTSNLHLEVDGQVVKNKEFGTIRCDSDSPDATITDTNPKGYHACIAFVRLSRFAFVSGSRVLAEFK